MEKIKEFLQKILSARYGKDVRQAIHDAIKQCYEDGKAGSVDLTAREEIGVIEELTTGVKDTIVKAINWLNNSLSTLSNSLVALAQRVSKNETDINNLNTNLNIHNTNKSNPHGITASQIGLGNVNNTADNTKSVKYAESAGSCTGNAATSTNATNHINNKSNPHGVTKAQIGLGNVDNTKDSAKYVNMANFLATQTVTESALDNVIYTGLYFISGANALVLHLRYDDNFAWQIWFSYGDYIYVRRKAEGNWLDWKTTHSW